MKEEFDRKPGLAPRRMEVRHRLDEDGPLQKNLHQIFMLNGNSRAGTWTALEARRWRCRPTSPRFFRSSCG